MIRALVLALCLLGLVACVGTPGPACTPAKLSEIEARYSARVIAECSADDDGGFTTLADCPAIGSLLAERAAEERAASCR